MQLSEQDGKGGDPTPADLRSYQLISIPAIDLQEEGSDSFANMQDQIFIVERDSSSSPLFPLATDNLSIRKW